MTLRRPSLMEIGALTPFLLRINFADWKEYGIHVGPARAQEPIGNPLPAHGNQFTCGPGL